LNKRGNEEGVFILAGGFREFMVHHKSEREDLFENYDANLWNKDNYHIFDLSNFEKK
jgi:hypothetical protein